MQHSAHELRQRLTTIRLAKKSFFYSIVYEVSDAREQTYGMEQRKHGTTVEQGLRTGIIHRLARRCAAERTARNDCGEIF
jgi:hypothetical protein